MDEREGEIEYNAEAAWEELIHTDAEPLYTLEEDTASNHPEPAVSPRKKYFRALSRRSAIVAAILAAIMGALVTAQALGVNVFGVVARWTTEIFRFTDRSVPYATVQTNPLAEGETRNYDTLQDAVDDFGIDTPLAPTWIPERFSLSEVTATNTTKIGISIFAIYSGENGYLRIYFNETSFHDYGIIEKNYEGARDVPISGLHHYILSDKEKGKAIWWNGELVCRISGSVTEQELELIIKSIYKRIDE